MTVSEYFADTTLKKQVAVTAALFDFQVIVVDFVLVSVPVLPVTTRLLTRGSRYIACTTCVSPTGGSVLSPLLHGSVSGVSGPVLAGEQESDHCDQYLLAFWFIPWPTPAPHPEWSNLK